MSNLTIPDEAVEAAAEALHADGCPECAEGDSERCPGWDMTREAEVALTAALPILHPAIPNTVEALEELPIGSVIRGNDADGPVAERETSDEWAIWDRSCTTPQLVGLGQRHDITEWTVLWPLGGAA